MKIELLEKIESLFWENSFAELSMDDVGKALGIKKSSLYYHFPSKDKMFLEVLEYSYAKYLKGIGAILSGNDFKSILKSLIIFPYESRNLYAVVLQKGYCRHDSVREFVMETSGEVNALFYSILGKTFSLSESRILILRSIIDDLGKKNCTIGCDNKENLESIANEIESLFS